MSQQRIAQALAVHGVHEFVDAEGTRSLIALHWSQDAPQDGFEDPTGKHHYIAGEIMDEGVEIVEGNRVHSFMVREFNTPESFARNVHGLITAITTY